jgi:hypothetical protein
MTAGFSLQKAGKTNPFSAENLCYQPDIGGGECLQGRAVVVHMPFKRTKIRLRVLKAG